MARSVAWRETGTLTTLTLVAESDAPCRFQLSRADLSYRLTYQGVLSHGGGTS